MLFSELPSGAFPIHYNNDGEPVMWADRQTRTVYSRDMLDFNLINRREFTQEENFQTEEELSQGQARSENSETISGFLSDYVNKAINDIGPASKLPDGSPNPELTPGMSTINAMIAQKNQDFNSSFLASPASFMKPILRWVRNDRNALVAVIRVQQQLLDSANIGSVE